MSEHEYRKCPLCSDDWYCTQDEYRAVIQMLAVFGIISTDRQIELLLQDERINGTPDSTIQQ